MNAHEFTQAHNALLNPPDPTDPPVVDHAQNLMDAFMWAPIAYPLGDDAPEPGYREVTPETMLGELLSASRIPEIHNAAMALILLAARGQSITEAARAFLQRLADEYAEAKQ